MQSYGTTTITDDWRRRRRPCVYMYVTSHLGSHLIQLDIGSISYLISEFFHLSKVLNVEHASSLGPAMMEEGRREGLFSGTSLAATVTLYSENIIEILTH